MNEIEQKILRVFSQLKIQIRNIDHTAGPRVTLYKVYLESDIGGDIIISEDDFDIEGLRIFDLDDCIGFEVVNEGSRVVSLESLLESEELSFSNARLPIALGVGVDDKVRVLDLVQAPHLLIAGATRGEETGILHCIIRSLLSSKRPDEMRLNIFSNRGMGPSRWPAYPKEYIFDPFENENNEFLEAFCSEMDKRISLIQNTGSTNIEEYNKNHKLMPYIVIVISEYDRLLSKFEDSYSQMIRIAMLGKQVGIHLVITSAHNSHKSITGLIKANFPTRIAFQVASQADSSIIIDRSGAEKLIGVGDALLLSEARVERIQCPIFSEEEFLTFQFHKLNSEIY